MPQKYGALANAEPVERVSCLVCDDERPTYSWTDYSGEGYCVQCGTPYQLKWGNLKDGETYPRINVLDVWIPILRRFWEETRSVNGAGTFISSYEYQDQLEGRKRFNEWCDAHRDELPIPPPADDAIDPPAADSGKPTTRDRSPDPSGDGQPEAV